jgi:hypothetical protein
MVPDYDHAPDQAPPDDRICTLWMSDHPCPLCGGELIANGRDVDRCNNRSCEFGSRKRVYHELKQEGGE